MKAVGLAYALCGILAVSAVAQDSIWKTYFEAAMSAYMRGDYAESEKLAESALAEAEKIPKQNPKRAEQAVPSLDVLANASLKLGNNQKAELVLRRLLTELKESKGDGERNSVTVLNNLGLCLANQKRFVEAETTLRQALKLKEKYEGPGSTDVAISLVNLGKVMYDQDKIVEAGAILAQAEKIFLKSEVTIETGLAFLECQYNIALIEFKQKRYDLAEQRFKLAMSTAERFYGADHAEMTKFYLGYGDLLHATGRQAEAAKVRAKALLLQVK